MTEPTFECEYPEVECDNLGSDMSCRKDCPDGDGRCPGEKQEDEDDD